MMGLLSEEGITAGRFKVRRLMSELGLICKQPGPHAYKQATVDLIKSGVVTSLTYGRVSLGVILL